MFDILHVGLLDVLHIGLFVVVHWVMCIDAIDAVYVTSDIGHLLLVEPSVDIIELAGRGGVVEGVGLLFIHSGGGLDESEFII